MKPLLFLLSTLLIHAATSYTITDLGTLGGPYSAGYSINNAGQITGDATPDAFLWNGSSMSRLGPSGNQQRIGLSINNSGHITGANGNFAFYWDGTTMTDIGTLGGPASAGYGINDLGQITGFSSTAGNAAGRAFLWNGSTMRDLGTLGGSNSVGYAINNGGYVTGRANVLGSSTEWHAFVSNGTTMVDIGTLGGPTGGWSEGAAINDSGHVTGNSLNAAGTGYRAFFWDGTTMTDIGTLGGPGGSKGLGINNAGTIVGTSVSPVNADHAFIWTNGVMSDLNFMLQNGDGWVLNEARDINDNGQITGFGRINGQTRAFLLNPTENTPEPATALLLGASLLLLYSQRKRAVRP